MTVDDLRAALDGVDGSLPILVSADGSLAGYAQHAEVEAGNPDHHEDEIAVFAITGYVPDDNEESDK